MTCFLRVWEWIKKYWKYLLFPVVVLLGILAVMARRKGLGDVVAPKEVETEPKRIAANEEARRKALKAEEAKQKAVEKLEQEHADTLKKLTDGQKTKVEELKNDPDKLNEFLLNVGREIRG